MNLTPTKIKFIPEAQTQRLQLLTFALKGAVVIAKDNIPIVRLVPIKPQRKRQIAGLHKGATKGLFIGEKPNQGFGQDIPPSVVVVSGGVFTVSGVVALRLEEGAHPLVGLV